VAPYLPQETLNFLRQPPGILTASEFCAVSQPSACGIGSLMVMLGTVGNAGSVEATALTRASPTDTGTSDAQVPLPGALGLFGMALLIFGVIRRKQSA
jgi:hypothetical protein